MITNEDEHLFIHLFMMCVDFYEIAAFSYFSTEFSLCLKSEEKLKISVIINFFGYLCPHDCLPSNSLPFTCFDEESFLILM